MNKKDHDGMGAGFPCPAENCDSIEAYIDFVKDADGKLTHMLCECARCGEQFTEKA